MPEDDSIELRCSTKLHAVVQGHYLETTCGSRFCGKRPGVVVLHRFDLFTGEMTTRMFKEPPTTIGGNSIGTRRQSAAVRNARDGSVPHGSRG